MKILTTTDSNKAYKAYMFGAPVAVTLRKHATTIFAREFKGGAFVINHYIGNCGGRSDERVKEHFAEMEKENAVFEIIDLAQAKGDSY